MEAIYTTNYFELPQTEYLQTAEFLEESPEKHPQQKESSPTSLDKLKLPNEKQTETEPLQKTKLEFINQMCSSETERSCQEHEGEELQFFSFTNNKAVCSECLVSGAYVGCKVASLKKAADQIKPKYEDLIAQVVERAKKLEPYENSLENKKKDLDGFATEYKLEIAEQFDKLRTAINNKEKEILTQIEKVKEERETEFENQQRALKTTCEDIFSVRKILESKLDGFKELDLCQFYARKAKLIQSFIEEESTSILKRLKQVSKTESFKEQFNVNDHHEEVNALLERLNGPNIGSFGAPHNEHKFTLTPRCEEKPLGSDSSRSLVIHKGEGGSTLENTPAPTVPVLSKIALTLPTSRKSSANGRCPSPFEIEEDFIITPLSGKQELITQFSNGEETLRRLFEKVETGRQQREIKDSRQDARSHSNTAVEKTKGRGKEIMRKNWEIKKEDLEKNCNKCQVMPSTIKVTDLDSKKNFPRSYIPEFSSRNASPNEIASGRGKKEINLASAKELLSNISLRKFSRDESNRTGPVINLELKRPGRVNEENSHMNKSHGSASSLSSNLMKLKRQMGLGDFNN